MSTQEKDNQNVLRNDEQRDDRENYRRGSDFGGDQSGLFEFDDKTSEKRNGISELTGLGEMGNRESGETQGSNEDGRITTEVENDGGRASENGRDLFTEAGNTGNVSERGDSNGGIGAVSDTLGNAELLDFTSKEEFKIGGLRDKYTKNIEALDLILNKDIEELSNDDKQKIAHYSGWGGLPQAFDSRNEGWSDSYQELKNLLSEDDYKTARASVIDSFYTPIDIRNAMWDGLEKLGLINDDQNKLVLEPSVGTGNFLANKPSSNLSFTTVELDNISHKMVSALYPNQTHFHRGFETIDFSPEFDAVISNPPFSSQRMVDKDPELNGLSLHNYFLAKSQKALAEKGVSAYVVSSTFMDGKDDRARQLIDRDSTFLGAVRLPNNAFGNAHTSVMTDVIFFQKGKTNQNLIEHDWLALADGKDADQRDYSINEYFANNPQNVLGDLQVRTGQFGLTLVCNKNSDTLDFSSFIESLPANIYEKTAIDLDQPQNDEIRIKLNEDHPIHSVRNNQFFRNGDEVYYRTGVEQSSAGEIVKANKFIPAYQVDVQRMHAFIDIRDKLNELYKSQKDPSIAEEVVDEIRRELNEIYDKKITGNPQNLILNRTAMTRSFWTDVDAGKVLALEKGVIDEIKKEDAIKLGVDPRPLSAKKADIFSRRTVRHEKNIVLENVEDALIASYNEFGDANLSWIAKQLSITEDKAKEDLLTQNLIFIDHETGNPITPEKYLSGNVVKKLEEAKEKSLEDPSFRRNVNALTKIQPERVRASDIGVDISSSWIPEKYISQYMSNLLRTNNFKIFKDEEYGSYDIELSSSSLAYSVRERVETKKCDPARLIKSLLSSSPVKITKKALDEDGNPILTGGGNETREDDEEAIAQVRTLQNAIKRDFQDWIWKDPERRNDIEDVYNSIFNTNVMPTYNGEHLTLTGLNPKFELRKHQKDAIWRGLQEGGGLLDHVVGAGKTLAGIAIAMESKKMGLHNKPMVAVPNHLVYQWRDAIYDAYPEANVLVPTKEEFDKSKREQFYGKVASNEWDLVIMPHSQFSLIPPPPEVAEEILNEEIEAILKTMDNVGDKKSPTIKQLQKRIDSREQNLNELMSVRNASEALDFSDLGVDALIVDEAHEFKNLAFTTEKDGVLGLGDPKGAKKATDLYAKVKWINKNNNNRGVFFLTGTPISNTIAEMYTMQRYLQEATLKERGIDKFDAWASSFGEVGHTWELDSSGTRYKLVSRFNKFKNVPELMSLYKQFADVVDNEDIAKYNGNLIPEARGGKPLNIVVPRSEQIANYIGVQDPITGEYGKDSVIWRMDNSYLDKVNNNMLFCTNDARKAGLDYRLIDASAIDEPISKLNAVVDHVVDEYVLYNEHKGTQLIFCDLSVAKRSSQSINVNEPSHNQSGENDLTVRLEDLSEAQLAKLSADEKLAISSQFDAYSDMLIKLVNKGIPQEEIRFIHDCKNDEQRAKLFRDVNDGKVRILIGSTGKMGAGMNVQERLTAMHHVDCPWRPSDIEQRNGRGFRQGNYFHNNPELFPDFKMLEVRYSTQNTYDARMWEINEQKSLAIEQLRKAGKSNLREMDDVSSNSSNAAEMKAASTGNPLMQMQQEIKQLLKTQESQYSHFLKQEHEQQDIYNHLKNLKLPYIRKEAYESMIADRTANEVLSVEIEKDGVISIEEQLVRSYEINGSTYSINLHDKNSTELRGKLYDEIKYSIENLQEENKQIEILKHRGLSLKLDKTITPIGLNSDDVIYNFELTNEAGHSFSPRNLEIRGIENGNASDLSISGLITRLNNAVEGLDTALEMANNDIADREAKLAFHENRESRTYEDMDLLFALRKDDEDILRIIRNQSQDEETASKYIPSYKLLDGTITAEDLLEERKTDTKVYIPVEARYFELIENKEDNFVSLGKRLTQAPEVEAQAEIQMPEAEEAQAEIQMPEAEEAQAEIQMPEAEEAQAEIQMPEAEEAQAEIQMPEAEEAQAEIQMPEAEVTDEVVELSFKEKLEQIDFQKIAMRDGIAGTGNDDPTIGSVISSRAYIDAILLYEAYIESNNLEVGNKERADALQLLIETLDTYPNPFVSEMEVYAKENHIDMDPENLSDEGLYALTTAFEQRYTYEDKHIKGWKSLEHHFTNSIYQEVVKNRPDLHDFLKENENERNTLDGIKAYKIHSYREFSGIHFKSRVARADSSYPEIASHLVKDIEKELMHVRISANWFTEDHSKDMREMFNWINTIKEATPYHNEVKMERMAEAVRKIEESSFIAGYYKEENRIDQPLQKTLLKNDLEQMCDEMNQLYVDFKQTLGKDVNDSENSFKQDMDTKFDYEIKRVDEFVNGNVIDLTNDSLSTKVLDGLYQAQKEITEKLGNCEYTQDKADLLVEQEEKVVNMMSVDLNKQKDFYFIGTERDKIQYLSGDIDPLNTSFINSNKWIEVNNGLLKLSQSTIEKGNKIAEIVSADFSTPLVSDLSKSIDEISKIHTKLENVYTKLEYWSDCKFGASEALLENEKIYNDLTTASEVFRVTRNNAQISKEQWDRSQSEKSYSELLSEIQGEVVGNKTKPDNTASKEQPASLSLDDILNNAKKRREPKPDNIAPKEQPASLTLEEAMNSYKKESLLESDRKQEKVQESFDIFSEWNDEPGLTIDPDIKLKESIGELLGKNRAESFIKKLDDIIPSSIEHLPEVKREELQRNCLISYFKENGLTQNDNKALALSYIEYTESRIGKADRISVPRLMQYDTKNLEKNFNIAKKDIEEYYSKMVKGKTSVTEDPRVTKTKMLYARYENLFQNLKKEKEKSLEVKSPAVVLKERKSGRGR